jgi:ubiquitin carboxyl-terminal hydrolase 5/13
MEQRLQCLGCEKVRYTTTEQDNLYIDIPKEKLSKGEDVTEEADSYKAVTLEECLDRLTEGEVVDLTCSSCGSKDGFTKRSLFKTFPDILVVNASKMAVVNWVPIKVDVPVLVPNAPFALDQYISTGLQDSEEALPDEPDIASPSFVPNPTALEQLEGMGFPRLRCERALHSTGNSDANAAMEWLFAHMDDPDIDAPLDLGGPSAPMADDPAKMELLMAMGFGAPQAKKALRETGGDTERAVEWLFSHPDDQGTFDDNTPPAVTGTGPTKVSKELVGSARLPAEYRLQSIVCHKGTSIHAG